MALFAAAVTLLIAGIWAAVVVFVLLMLAAEVLVLLVAQPNVHQ